jgi:TolB-like protein/Tfp pilus assembly protein PilF
MADIFISYSRKDSVQALSLVERLRANGLDVWIDQHGIEASTSWSKEIANALKECHTMVLLLSPMAVASANVAKELSVAAQLKKRIVPIQIEPVELEGEFLYHLSGLHRAKYSDFDSILRAITKSNTGSGIESRIIAPGLQPQIPIRKNQKKYFIGFVALLAITIGTYFLFFAKKTVSANTEIKTIAVLPFESLSAEKENDFFADGMTGTLIDMLMSVSELHVIDRRTSMEYKSTKLDIKSLGAALESRYLVGGTVQRQGDQIMISAQMTDAGTGTVLFSKSFSGKTADLLELQKQIAESIIVELQLAFNPDNSITFSSESRSSNPQAHELCMKADYAEGQGELDTAIAYFIQAAKHDSAFAFPYLMVARLYGNLAMSPHSLPRYIILADSFLAIGKRLDTAQRYYHHMASWIASVKGDYDIAISEATAHIKKQPRKPEGYNALGLVYLITKQYRLAAQNFIEELKRDPSSNQSRFYLMVSFWLAHDTVQLNQCSTQAIPIFEASLVRRPDDKDVRNNSIPLALVWSGRGDEACKRMEQLLKTKGVDSQYFLNTAAINALSGKLDRAMELMRQEVARLGVQKVDFDRGFFDNIRNYPEFKAWIKQKEALAKKNG